MNSSRFWIKIAFLILVILIVVFPLQSMAAVPVRITPRTAADFSYVSVSPDGKWVVFTSNFKKVKKRYGDYIWLADASNFSLKKAKLVTDIGRDYYPAWSPDGDWIAFESYGKKLKHSEIWKIKSNGEGLKRLTNFIDGENCVCPAWSPNGRHIIFSKSNNLWIINADGLGCHRLTPLRSIGYECPSNWSPDGKWIIFSVINTSHNSGAGIWIVSSDGKYPKRIADAGRSPIWTPEGRYILWLQGNDIWRMCPDGKEKTKLIGLKEKHHMVISQMSMGRKRDLWFSVFEEPVPARKDVDNQMSIWRVLFPPSVLE